MIKKILVLSDTHGDIDQLLSVIEYRHLEISHILFLGDGAVEVIEAAYTYKDLIFFAVTGNNDFGLKPNNRVNFPLERVEEINFLKIYMTHGHIANYSRVQEEVSQRAKEQGADLAFYGHLHIPFLGEYNGVKLASSGSLSYPRAQSKAAYILLTIINGEPKIDFYHSYTHELITKDYKNN